MKFTGNLISKKSVMFVTCISFIIIGCLFVSTINAHAQSGVEDDPQPVTGITAGRARALAGAAIGLVSIIAGWRAKARFRATRLSGSTSGNIRTQAVIALILGGVAVILSVIHLSTSAGAVFGSGSGKAGAIVALVFALVGLTLGGQALRAQKE